MSGIKYSYWFVVFFSDSCTLASEEVYYIHTDHLGSTSVITQNATKISESKYYPYGTIRAENTAQSAKVTEKGYTGQISDKTETGFFYYNARYYDPSIAKFTQVDILGDDNRYAYVSNNPINGSDPTGNCDLNDPACRAWMVLLDYFSNPPSVNDNLPSSPAHIGYATYGGFDCGANTAQSCLFSSAGNGQSNSKIKSLSEILGGKARNYFDDEAGWMVLDPKDELADIVLNSVTERILSQTGGAREKLEMVNSWIAQKYDYDSISRVDSYTNGTASLGSVLIVEMRQFVTKVR